MFLELLFLHIREVCHRQLMRSQTMCIFGAKRASSNAKQHPDRGRGLPPQILEELWPIVKPLLHRPHPGSAQVSRAQRNLKGVEITQSEQ